jgi:hypothetical protein
MSAYDYYSGRAVSRATKSFRLSDLEREAYLLEERASDWMEQMLALRTLVTADWGRRAGPREAFEVQATIERLSQEFETIDARAREMARQAERAEDGDGGAVAERARDVSTTIASLLPSLDTAQRRVEDALGTHGTA